nr:hypothetical protein [Pirellulaceae bacterium]
MGIHRIAGRESILAVILLLVAGLGSWSWAADEPGAAPAATESTADQAPPAPAAAPAGPTTAELKVMADTLWVLITGML